MVDGDDSDYEENWDYHGTCDCCNKSTADFLCPLFDEDIGKGVVPGEICEDCCKATFEDDPCACIQNGDCEQAEKQQLFRLKEIAKEHNYVKSERRPNSFTNRKNTIGVSVSDSPKIDPTDKMIPLLAFYNGKKYVFVRTKKRKYAFSKGLVNEALSILKGIGEDDLEYGILSKSKALAFEGYFAWAVVAGLDINYPYFVETDIFVENVKNGYTIFKEDVEKEIRIVDLTTDFKLDWHLLNPKQFEELCRDILCSFESISHCLLTGASGDEGRDIKAKETVVTISGTELRNWCIQCKHFPSRPLGRHDIEDLNTLHTRFKFDVYCIITSSSFSPNAIRVLEEYEKQGNYRVEYFDKHFLENRIKHDSKLHEKFMSLSENKTRT